MSRGHPHHHGFGLDTAALDRILANSDVMEKFHRPFELDKTQDMPYVAGYSVDGSRIYLDRHLPPEVEITGGDDWRVTIRPEDFLQYHERMEKACIDALGYSYPNAHRVATAFERRRVTMMLGPRAWVPYQRVWAQYAKHDEHEKLRRMPADFDMTPVLAPPVDKALVARVQRAMGAERQHTKEEAHYGDGKPGAHCGPVAGWQHGDCAHFTSPNSCVKVRGYISPRGWCKYWEEA